MNIPRRNPLALVGLWPRKRNGLCFQSCPLVQRLRPMSLLYQIQKVLVNIGGNRVSVFSPSWMMVKELQRPYNQSERHQRELRRTLLPVVMSLTLTNAAGNLHNWVNCFI